MSSFARLLLLQLVLSAPSADAARLLKRPKNTRAPTPPPATLALKADHKAVGNLKASANLSMRGNLSMGLNLTLGGGCQYCTCLVADIAKCGADLVTDGVKCGSRALADAAKCGSSMVADAAKCGTSMVADAAKCGTSMVADAAKCGVSTVTDAAKCGTNFVADAAKCGVTAVTDGAKCGWNAIADGARCGWDAVTDAARCGTSTITDAARCGADMIKSCRWCTGRWGVKYPCCNWGNVAKTCSVAKSCNVAKTCNVPKSCNIPNTCNIPKTCNIPNTCNIPKTCSIANTCNIPNTCNVPNTCSVPKTCNVASDFSACFTEIQSKVNGVGEQFMRTIAKTGCTSPSACADQVKNGLAAVGTMVVQQLKDTADALASGVTKLVGAWGKDVVGYVDMMYTDAMVTVSQVTDTIESIAQYIGGFFSNLPKFQPYSFGSVCSPSGVGPWWMVPTDCGAFGEFGSIFTDFIQAPAHFNKAVNNFGTCVTKTGAFGVPTPFFDLKVMQVCMPNWLSLPLSYIVGAMVYMGDVATGFINLIVSVKDKLVNFVKSKFNLLQMATDMHSIRRDSLLQNNITEEKEMDGNTTSQVPPHGAYGKCGPNTDWTLEIGVGWGVDLTILGGKTTLGANLGVQFGCYKNYLYPPNLMFGFKIKETPFPWKGNGEALWTLLTTAANAMAKAAPLVVMTETGSTLTEAQKPPAATADSFVDQGPAYKTSLKIYMKFGTSFPQFIKGRVDMPKAGLETAISVKGGVIASGIKSNAGLQLNYMFTLLPDPNIPTGFGFEVKFEQGSGTLWSHYALAQEVGRHVEGASQAFAQRAIENGHDPVAHTLVAGMAALDVSPHFVPLLDSVRHKHEHIMAVAQTFYDQRENMVRHAMAKNLIQRHNITVERQSQVPALEIGIDISAAVAFTFCLTPYTVCMGQKDS